MGRTIELRERRARDGRQTASPEIANRQISGYAATTTPTVRISARIGLSGRRRRGCEPDDEREIQ